tara:strand:- start:99 stop:314 length:216 start_codon:yes stop_codon:yes gene_type:complete
MKRAHHLRPFLCLSLQILTNINNSGINSAESLLNRISYVNENAFIDLTNGNEIQIQNLLGNWGFFNNLILI